jgi:S1-C subfamily serine protease
MAVSSSSTLIRVCPACARRVTPPALTCHCGTSVDGVALTAPPPRVVIPPPPDTTRRDTALKIAIAVTGLALAGVIIYRSSRPSSPLPPVKIMSPAAAAPTAAATRPVAPAAPPEGAAETPPAPEPTALERVMAAAAASKRAEAARAPVENAPAAAPAPSGTLEDIVSRAMPAVVRVETATGFGSGFFISADTMLTNVHVVGTNLTVTIRRPDGKTLVARVETSAAELDVAVIRIANPDPAQPTLTMGSGATARAGQEVIALGTPLGLQNTVTRGIVSAVRQVGGLTLVQTDAAINPGNSGGPLLDRSGQVIGITTMGVKSSEAQGLGFAVAIEHAQALLAGKRSLDQRGTPLSTLNDAMSGRPSGDAGGARDRGARAYEAALAAIARRANGLDEQWVAFKRICYQGPIAAVAGHEWFAIWTAGAMQGTVAPGCTSALNNVRQAADGIRTDVLAAVEAARQVDVYPGTRRELLDRYRLNYAGWDR